MIPVDVDGWTALSATLGKGFNGGPFGASSRLVRIHQMLLRPELVRLGFESGIPHDTTKAYISGLSKGALTRVRAVAGEFGYLSSASVFRDVLERSVACDVGQWSQVLGASHDVVDVDRLVAGHLSRLFDFEAWGGRIILPDRIQASTYMSRFDIVLNDVRMASSRVYSALIPHLGLVVMIEPLSDDQRLDLQSASLPEADGVLALNVAHLGDIPALAELVVHECAHLKFFNVIHAFGILPISLESRFNYAVPWPASPTDFMARSWGLDQSLAAAHAYLHVAWFYCSLSIAAQCQEDPMWLNEGSSSFIESFRSTHRRARALLGALRLAPSGEFGPDGPGFVRWLAARSKDLEDAAELLSSTG